MGLGWRLGLEVFMGSDDLFSSRYDEDESVWADDGGFAGSEGIGSTRVPEPGQVWCKCDDPTHRNHERPEWCGEQTHTNDGYCRECHRLRGRASGESES